MMSQETYLPQGLSQVHFGLVLDDLLDSLCVCLIALIDDCIDDDCIDDDCIGDD